jgi:hypothetical protein
VALKLEMFFRHPIAIALVMLLIGCPVSPGNDRVKLHNTNRSLLFLPRHAGWRGSSIEFKANILASVLPDALPFTAWYDVCQEIADRQFDVILCLANERDVRTIVAQRLSTVVLHATTGRDWLSILHRHIAGKDDCIRCRTRDMRTPDFECSTAKIRNAEGGRSQDASLPFLSAASGLMLATALQKLQMGTLDRETLNEWHWDFASSFRIAKCGQRQCLGGRSIAATPASVRREINKDLKWAHLDKS